MMTFTRRYDDDGFSTVELSEPVEPVTEFSKELVDEACAIGVDMTRDGNAITLHCSNGEWTYRLTAYHYSRGVYRGELAERHDGACGPVNN